MQPSSGKVNLRGINGGSNWRIDLQSHSPLSTVIRVQHSSGDSSGKCEEQALWSFLGQYTRNEDVAAPLHTGYGMPDKVAEQTRSVVCITGDERAKHVQLTGFVIDETGSIVSTAHDMEQSYRLAVSSGAGSPASGHVVRIDHGRDLALIKTDFKLGSFISLDKARFFLRFGEKIYTIGCPRNVFGSVAAGYVAGPPRLADGRVLWQVNLSTMPGGSGSPVFDEEGRLVGVVKGRYRGTDSVGFLIPVTTVLEFMRR
jgi:serine protease Do